MLRVLGLVAVLVVALCLCGCPKPAGTTAPPVTGAPTPPVMPSTEAPAPTPAPAEKAAEKPSEGVAAEKKVGIEYYPGAKVEVQQSDAKAGSEMAALSTSDARDKVTKFYKDKYGAKAAKNAGTAASVQGADVITWNEDGKMYSVTVMKKDHKTTGIMLFARKQ
ncbi:MAG: hypothetical protein ABFD96_05745 [Armatimonadia bacterium]